MENKFNFCYKVTVTNALPKQCAKETVLKPLYYFTPKILTLLSGLRIC